MNAKRSQILRCLVFIALTCSSGICERFLNNPWLNYLNSVLIVFRVIWYMLI